MLYVIHLFYLKVVPFKWPRKELSNIVISGNSLRSFDQFSSHEGIRCISKVDVNFSGKIFLALNQSHWIETTFSI